jgi:PiT family inorganic phosphate transporter
MHGDPIMEWLLLSLTLALAAANGSNDVSKGIATLVGSGVTDLRRAVLWGSLWTVLGGIAAAYLSTELIATFSGKGLLAATIGGPEFLAAVGIGASGWVAVATRTGLPVSTTHALVGALTGVGLWAAGFDGIHWGAMGKKVVLSLLLGPLISLILLYLLAPLLSRLSQYLNRRSITLRSGTHLASMLGVLQAVSSRESRSDTTLNALDAMHWLSAGLASFARGMNDTPKVLALGFTAALTLGLTPLNGFIVAAIAMGLGSITMGLRVTHTLATKVTPLSPAEGFGANLVTALLVGCASNFGLPVSTTHVSSGAILAAGIRRDAHAVQWNTVGEMLLAWVVTLPCAATFAAVAYAVITH